MSKYLSNGSELTLGKIVSLSLVTLIIAGGISLEMFLFNFDDAHAATSGAISFSSNRDGDYEIYIMDADGTNIDMLTKNSAQDIHPSLSPDGTKIAFATDRDGDYEIFIMNTDGSALKRLTNNNAKDTFPTFSQNGKYIAFTSNRDGNSEIYTMNIDGSNQRNITNNSWYDAAPSISPEAEIAFYSNRDGNFEIYVTDGRNTERLTNNNAADRHPTFSPDGKSIAFASNRDGNQEIYIMNSDGKGQANVSKDKSAKDTLPAFGPDGDIAFMKETKLEKAEIYILFVDGTEPTSITNNPAVDNFPTWSITPNVDIETDSSSNSIPPDLENQINDIQSKLDFVNVQFDKAESEIPNVTIMAENAVEEARGFESEVHDAITNARTAGSENPGEALELLEGAQGIYDNNLRMLKELREDTSIKIDSKKTLINSYLTNAETSCTELRDAQELLQEYSTSLDVFDVSGLITDIETTCSDDNFSEIKGKLNTAEVRSHRFLRMIDSNIHRLDSVTSSTLSSLQETLSEAIQQQQQQQTEIPDELDSQITIQFDHTDFVQVDNESYRIQWDVLGGLINNVRVDWPSDAVIFDVSASSSGSVKVKLPRTLIDAKDPPTGESDTRFGVFVDGSSVPYSEPKKTNEYRILKIPFDSSSSEIMVVGTELAGGVMPMPDCPPDEPECEDGASANLGPIPCNGTVELDRYSYTTGETVSVDLKLEGEYANPNIDVTVVDPIGNIVLSETVQAQDDDGLAHLEFDIPETMVSGEYQITMFHQGKSTEHTDSKAFFIQDSADAPTNSGIQPETSYPDQLGQQEMDGFSGDISNGDVSVMPTDQQGNPVDSFIKGGLGFAKVIVDGSTNTEALVTVNLFSSDSTSLGVGSFKGTVSGDSEMIISFYIPEQASSGGAEIFANVFSDWPTNGGVPLTGEVSGEVILE